MADLMLEAELLLSRKRTLSMFQTTNIPLRDEAVHASKIRTKVAGEYALAIAITEAKSQGAQGASLAAVIKTAQEAPLLLTDVVAVNHGGKALSAPSQPQPSSTALTLSSSSSSASASMPSSSPSSSSSSSSPASTPASISLAVQLHQQAHSSSSGAGASSSSQPQAVTSALVTTGTLPTAPPEIVAAKRAAGPQKAPIPTWHAPWELSSVISGHLGWVRCVAVDPTNEWFCTGSADRTIKIWDLAKCSAGAEGGLKLTLTGHSSTVRGVAISDRHPYMFSVGEDMRALCWDLEYNRVIREYHGHLAGIYCVAVHPTLDLLVTGGRDSAARLWDMRTKQQVHQLSGHSDIVGSIITSPIDPQIITASYDKTIRLWDLVAGKPMSVLTHHKKAVRALAAHPRELTFVSGAADNIKKWQHRDGSFLTNLMGHNAVVNALACSEDSVLVSGADNGTLAFWDYNTGHCFQKTETIVQPGSLDAEAGIFATAFDKTGSRLITCEADKSIKIWRENSNANPDTHPIDMREWSKTFSAQRRF